VVDHFRGAFPLATKSESYLVETLGKRVIVYDFLNGSPRSTENVSERMVDELGGVLASMHNIQSDLPALPEFPMGISEMNGFLHGKTHCTVNCN
jgi:hypothetical protein